MAASTSTVPTLQSVQRYRRAALVGRVALYLIVAAMLFYAISPFYWMVNSSLQFEKDVVSVPPNWLPPEVNFGNYTEIILRKPADTSVEFDKSMAAYSTFPTADVLPSMWNSFVVALGVTIINVVFGCLAAYGFARLRFAGKQYLFYVVLASRIVPEISLIVPFYLMIRGIGLLDTYMGLKSWPIYPFPCPWRSSCWSPISRLSRRRSKAPPAWTAATASRRSGG